MIFSTLDWAQVQPGLAWQEPDAVRGTVVILDAAGLAIECEYDLRVSPISEGHERLAGSVYPSSAIGGASGVALTLDLETDVGMHLTKLVISVKEQHAEPHEMSVTLASAATLAHWTVYYLARKLGSGWLLQLEIDKDNVTDRAASRLLEELLLVCELAAESIDDCAGILPPLGMVG